MKNSALKPTASKRNGFEFLLDMLTSSNPNEVRKAGKIIKSWTKATKDKFISWYRDFLESDFVSKTSIQEARKEVEHLINSVE